MANYVVWIAAFEGPIVKYIEADSEVEAARVLLGDEAASALEQEAPFQWRAWDDTVVEVSNEDGLKRFTDYARVWAEECVEDGDMSYEDIVAEIWPSELGAAPRTSYVVP